MVMLVPGMPEPTDDDGSETVGTRLDHAFWVLVDAAIAGEIVSIANPGISAADIIDEIVTARGTLASLDARFDVEHNADGTQKPSGSIVYMTDAGESLFKNLCPDSCLYQWPDGDAAAPYKWALTGAGAACARAGDGLGDATKMAWGKWCAKLTYGAGVLKLTRTLLDATRFPQMYGLRGKTVTFAARCKSSIANHASIILDDGIVQTRGGLTGNGTYHSGSGNEEWLYVSIPLALTATKLDIIFDVAQAGTAHFGAVVVVLGKIIPTVWIPDRQGLFIAQTQQRGTLAIGTYINEMRTPFPLIHGGILRETKVKLKTTSAGSDVIYDVNKNNVTAYTTKPTVAIAATYGDAVPDGTYANRCFKEEDLLSVDCDQVGGAGNEGVDSTVIMKFLCPIDEFQTLDI